jgi:hypothetical protein
MTWDSGVPKKQLRSLVICLQRPAQPARSQVLRGEWPGDALKFWTFD